MIEPEIENKAWSITNSILFIIFLVFVFAGILTSFDVGNKIDNIKDSWGDYRCNPLFMPFAGLFGYDTKDNFNSCMGDVFKTHSEPYVKSSSSMFSGFTGILGTMLDSVNSLRNTMATLGGGINTIANSTVTSTFKLCGKGQPMVKLGNIIVSTNHYVLHDGKYIMACDHPDAIKTTETYDELYCLNTDNNQIRIGNYTFLDYDENTTADKDTMNYIENRINATNTTKTYNFTEYRPAINENTIVKTMNGPKMAKDIKLGDKLTTGSEIVGLIRTVVKETSILQNVKITPSTLYWDENNWKRVGLPIKEKCEMVSFIATPNSQIELENVRIRDYMELCSPDSEIYYSKSMK